MNSLFFGSPLEQIAQALELSVETVQEITKGRG